LAKECPVIAIEALISALGDSDLWTREAARDTLAKYDVKNVAPLLLNAIKNGSKDARWYAISTLNKLGHVPDYDKEVAVWYWQWKGDFNKCLEYGQLAVAPLLEIIFNGQSYCRGIDAAKAIVKVPEVKVLELLFQTSLERLKKLSVTPNYVSQSGFPMV
jgi:hypothetical protein